MCDGYEPSSSSLTSNTEQSLSSSAKLGDVESNPEGSEQQVVSLLDCLKQPQPSTLARIRKIVVNPPKDIKRSKGVTANDPNSVCASDRVRSYPNEPLTVSNNKTLLLKLSGGIVTEEEQH